MADDSVPKPQAEIIEPEAVPPPREPRRDPGVIEGEASEIREAPAREPPAAELTEPPAVGPEASPWPPPAARLVFAAGALGAVVGAALAIGAGWLLEPRAAALGEATARLSALERAADSRAEADADLAKRLAALESREAADAKAAALDALASRVAALEGAGGKGEAAEALDEARAARADAAKALALAAAAGQAPPPSPSAGAAPAAVDAAALEGRIGKLESDVAAIGAREPDLAAIDDRLAKLESALAAPKSEARVAAAEVAPPSDAAATAILAIALEQRLGAGASFAEEWAGLTRLGADAGRLAALRPYADSGAPTIAALAAGFAKLEPAVAAAASPPPSGVLDRLIDHMRALVRVRKAGEAGAEASPERVAAELARGDLAAALDAYGRLPEAARQAGADWAKAAEARQAAGGAARALRDEAVARLAAKD